MMFAFVFAGKRLVHNVLHTPVWPLFFTVMLNVRMVHSLHCQVTVYTSFGALALFSCHLPGSLWGLPCFLTLPLLGSCVPQITREAQILDLENEQINNMLAAGKTRQEIAQMGFYSALDPTVLGPEAAS